jgi:hypothetical protein
VKLSLLALAAVSLLSLATPSAQAAEGQLVATVRCLCAASMIVKIGDREGYILNDTKVDAVVLEAKGKQIRIEKPEHGIRHYYVVYDIAKDQQIVNALKAAGISAAGLDRVTLESFEAADDTPLFKDHSGTQRL